MIGAQRETSPLVGVTWLSIFSNQNPWFEEGMQQAVGVSSSVGIDSRDASPDNLLKKKFGSVML